MRTAEVILSADTLLTPKLMEDIGKAQMVWDRDQRKAGMARHRSLIGYKDEGNMPVLDKIARLIPSKGEGKG